MPGLIPGSKSGDGHDVWGTDGESVSTPAGISYHRNGRPTVNETCGIVSRSSSERSAVIMVPASPRISWIRDTQSTPDCAKGREAWERVI
jgi:hypothetical protein